MTIEEIRETFTKENEKINLEVDELTTGCISSKENNFSLDEEGNLIVRNINTQALNINTDININQIYPIGSIYFSVNNVNPSEYFGGTWVSWGSGRVPVGVDTSQTEFNTIEKTGGEKAHSLTSSENGPHSHQYYGRFVSGTNYDIAKLSGGGGVTSEGWRLPDTASSGSGQPHNNLQPYITCYMWKRTA